ncbi:MAG: class I SAM-dependent methyltransferase [Oscillospiraceae bacterium]|nr:class I SAM-dependent methyltransferase [Oscillospiraceae bacterium]
MPTLKLSKRLAAAASLVRRGSRAVDIGCDHGRLAAKLIQENICEMVIARDINAAPLARARALFERLDIAGRCTAQLADGLEGLCKDDADDIIIAGLGADIIIEIISKAPWLKDPSKRLVLLPSSRHAKLRRYLYREGFELISETAVVENGFCYSAMCAAYTGEKKEIDVGFAAIGLLSDSSEASAAYREREKRRARRLAASGAEAEKKESALRALEYISEVEQRIENERAERDNK